VRRKAIGVGAGAWLDGLPLLLASLEQEWGIAVGDAYYDSTEAFVAEATCEDGTPAVRHEILCSTARNALEAPGGFKLVDPDGLLTEPDYDLGIIMREDPLEGDPRERSRWLAAHTGLDTASIWDWGVVERVSTGLLGTKVGLQPVGRQILAVADRVAGTG
jgi:hypothetical protein